MSSIPTAHARVAGLSKFRTAEDPELVAAKQDLKALRLEDYVARVVAEAPPLTVEQRDRIAAILQAGARG
ncbi:hypothetical protein P3H15_11330 [Rhodococcus sp. T2V]|uniref:hypothetical protein n=1 Tax=Rhodococcus sp. T2V TaxID=3034164 RepID=UPI0023E10A0C|nr:hypothetical protein [Rhodococcus sp. T2V]MDF3305612.1 hypothetical protein [Rhodococcus sp. T2V]